MSLRRLQETTKVGVVERAHSLAQSGNAQSVNELRKLLKRDGFTSGEVEDHLRGSAIRRHLTALCRQSIRIDDQLLAKAKG